MASWKAEALQMLKHSTAETHGLYRASDAHHLGVCQVNKKLIKAYLLACDDSGFITWAELNKLGIDGWSKGDDSPDLDLPAELVVYLVDEQ